MEYNNSNYYVIVETKERLKTMKDDVLKICKEVMKCVVDENYDRLEELNAFKTISVNDLKEIISGYLELNGYEKVVYPPEESWEKTVYVIELSKGGYHIDMDLWMDNEWSDLTLQIDVKGDGSFEIEDCHVM